MLPEIRYARSGPQFIAYRVFGSGPPDLVVAPGYMSNVEQNLDWPAYRRFLDKLSSFSRVILFDRRGTGLSDRPGESATFDDFGDDIRAVMDDTGIERAAVMGGAEGGPMCLLFAATFPDRTSGLILVTTYARRMWAPDYPWGITADLDAQIVQAYEERWGRGPMGIRLLAPDLADDPAFRDWYVRALRSGGSPGAALAWYRITADIDVRDVLSAIRVPTLIMHRASDGAIPVEHGRYLAEQIAGARYVELPESDHFWFAGDMDAIIGEVQEFLTGIRPTPEPDRVLATIMFTDIVGSTQRAAALGDRRWQDALDSHNALVRRELAKFRGQEVDTAGDGFLATFDGLARAIRCLRRSPPVSATLGSRCESASIPGRSNSPVRTFEESPSTSARVCLHWRGRERYWSRALSEISWPAQGLSSRSAGCTRSRACRASGESSRQRRTGSTSHSGHRFNNPVACSAVSEDRLAESATRTGGYGHAWWRVERR
ncbi:MAG: alpha/beta fold hydrolase [Actinomycetota bacterium]